MATKTEEVLNVIQREITRLQTQMEGLQDEVTRGNLIGTRSTLAVLEAAVVELKQQREEADRRNERLAILESQFAEFKKQQEEKDRRWWQFWVGVGLIGFTFVANLVIQLILLFSRKPG
jgi:hypothetical protein